LLASGYAWAIWISTAAGLALSRADEGAKLLDDICVADSGHPVVVVTDGEEIVGFVSFTIDASQRTGEIGLNAVRLTMRGETSARTCTSTS